MAEPNQGKYRKYRKKCADIKNDYQAIKNDYFVNGNFEGDSVSLMSFFEDANDLYVKAIEMEETLSIMLDGEDFKMDKKKNEYIQLKEKMSKISDKISDKFSDMYSLNKSSLTDNGKKRIKRFDIYND